MRVNFAQKSWQEKDKVCQKRRLEMHVSQQGERERLCVSVFVCVICKFRWALPTNSMPENELGWREVSLYCGKAQETDGDGEREKSLVNSQGEAVRLQVQ